MMGNKPTLFLSDWKGEWLSRASRALAYPMATEPPLLARTHTAITHNGIAKDQDLFTTLARSVSRRDGSGKWGKRGWILIDISTAAAVDDDKARCLLGFLERGLDEIGKTGALATFKHLGRVPMRDPEEIAGRPGEYAIMLVTPAHILDTEKLAIDQGVAVWRKRHERPTRTIGIWPCQVLNSKVSLRASAILEATWHGGGEPLAGITIILF